MQLAEMHSNLREGTLDSAGHIALDIAGLIPGVGEPADIANAFWYAKNKEYLPAALSLISIIPEAGDFVGKGIKYALKGSKSGQKLLLKHGDKIEAYWNKVVAILQDPKVKKYVGKLIQKIDSGLKQEMKNARTS